MRVCDPVYTKRQTVTKPKIVGMYDVFFLKIVPGMLFIENGSISYHRTPTDGKQTKTRYDFKFRHRFSFCINRGLDNNNKLLYSR